jgi:hypothetical protein
MKFGSHDEDRETIEQRVVKRIRATLDQILPNGIIVAGVAHGPTGFSFVLSSEDETCQHTVSFPTPPIRRQIRAGVAECVWVIRRANQKGVKV